MKEMRPSSLTDYIRLLEINSADFSRLYILQQRERGSTAVVMSAVNQLHFKEPDYKLMERP